jgi:hypothetical protein
VTAEGTSQSKEHRHKMQAWMPSSYPAFS